jgi:type II secretory pathway pseudopilin PulG
MRVHGQALQPTGRRRNAPGGFTIIEVIVVLLIVMILAGMIVPAVAAGMRSTRLREAANETATAFRRARDMAITAGEIYSSQPLWVDGSATPPREKALVNIRHAPQVGSTSGAVLSTFVLPSGVDFTHSAAPSLEWVWFLPDGSVHFDTAYREVLLVPEGKGKPRYVISFRQLTGRIEIRREN